MPTKLISVRLPDELYDYLDAQAKNEQRTLSNMIVYLLYGEMTIAETQKLDKTNRIKHKLDKQATKLLSKIVLSCGAEKEELIQEKETIETAITIIDEYGKKLVSEINYRSSKAQNKRGDGERKDNNV